MKETTANTSLDVWVHCPYCENYQDATEELHEELGADLRAEDIEVQVTCDRKECSKTFIVTEVTY